MPAGWDLAAGMSHTHSVQAAFVAQAGERLKADPRIDAVLLAGAPLVRADDEFSDVDLVLVCADESYEQVMATRREVAASLGKLLAAFSGEHVGEPRVLICLFNEPLLHVDLKFVRREALAERVETPLVAFDRSGGIGAVLAEGTVEWPGRSPEWFEERFWIWIHYGAAKIARGELFEAHDMLAFLRAQVLGPMLARDGGHRQRGVRRIELEMPAQVDALRATIASYDHTDCWRALEATVKLYRPCRAARLPQNLRPETERAVAAYIAQHAGSR